MSVFGVFLVRIFPHSDWIPRFTPKMFVFSANLGKYGPADQKNSEYGRFLRSNGTSLIISRSSYRRCSVKKGALKNFANFTEKQICWSLFLIKLQAWKTVALLKRDSNIGLFLWILQILRHAYFEAHLRTAASAQSAITCSKLTIETLDQSVKYVQS